MKYLIILFTVISFSASGQTKVDSVTVKYILQEFNKDNVVSFRPVLKLGGMSLHETGVSKIFILPIDNYIPEIYKWMQPKEGAFIITQDIINITKPKYSILKWIKI